MLSKEYLAGEDLLNTNGRSVAGSGNVAQQRTVVRMRTAKSVVGSKDKRLISVRNHDLATTDMVTQIRLMQNKGIYSHGMEIVHVYCPSEISFPIDEITSLGILHNRRAAKTSQPYPHISKKRPS